MKNRQLLEMFLTTSEQDFICNLASQFPSETSLLCGEVQASPGITHDLFAEYSEDELPSAILLKKSLLPNSVDNTYNRTDFAELNRGYAAANALRLVMLGGDDNYHAFVRGQSESVRLTIEQFKMMHSEYNDRFNTDDLKIAGIYMSAFNDVGKSITLLRAASQIKGEAVLDHDEVNSIIVNNPAARMKYLPGLASLHDDIQTMICSSISLDFNPSCFTQGEYPLFPITQISDALSKVEGRLREGVFSLIKIESAMDVAGVKGHQAPGGAAYNKFVHVAFNAAFQKLSDLFKGKSAIEVYLDYIGQNANKFGLTQVQSIFEKICLTRIALMIRASGESDRDIIMKAYQLLKKEYPEIASCLVEELGRNNLNANAVWMQYSPDLLRILTKENTSEQTPIQGLLLGLRIYGQVLFASRQQIGKSPCFMAQGRDIIPIVRNAANGNLQSMSALEHAAKGGVLLVDGNVQFKEIDAVRNNTILDFSIFAPKVEQKSDSVYGISINISGNIN